MVDLKSAVQALGYFGLLFIIFAESGLFFGFFFPGDSLLFTAGLLSSQGYFNIFFIVIISFFGAVAGDNFGYFFGKKTGKKLFRKEDSLIFKKSHVKKAEKFYKDHGAKTIVLARFVPIVRTFAPILAGVGEMHYPDFLTYNFLGAILWAVGIPLAGYFLGESIPNVDHYIVPILTIIIVVSSIPYVYEFFKHRKEY